MGHITSNESRSASLRYILVTRGAREEEDALPYLRIVQPEISAELYDTITSNIEVTKNHPLGLIMHAAGEADGVWRIVEVWEAEEYAESFDRDVLVPAVEAVTGSPPPGDAPVVGFDLRQLVTP
jgi:hypothetical protein